MRNLLYVNVLALGLWGCQVPDHNDSVVFVTSTRVGINVGVDTYQKPTIDLGYNRQEGAIVPVYKEDSSGSHIVKSEVDALAVAYVGKALEYLAQSEDNSDSNAVSYINTAAQVYKNHNYKTPAALNEVVKYTSSGKSFQPDTRIRIKELAEVYIGLVNSKGYVVNYNDGKYIARSTGANGEIREDAYSVFGTFSGSASSSSNANDSSPDGIESTNNGSFEGSVSQSFATGVAAQIWAAQGAGVVGGIPNNSNKGDILSKIFPGEDDPTLREAFEKGRIEGVAELEKSLKSIQDFVYPEENKDVSAYEKFCEVYVETILGISKDKEEYADKVESTKNLTSDKVKFNNFIKDVERLPKDTYKVFLENLNKE